MEDDATTWAVLAGFVPRPAVWDVEEELYTHLLVRAHDMDACRTLVASVLDDHDGDFSDFVFAEPLKERIQRGVVDPRWAASAQQLTADTSVFCSGHYEGDDLLRPFAVDDEAELWVGTVVARNEGDEDELVGVIAAASSVEEFTAAAADYVERLGMTVLRWHEHLVAVELPAAVDMLDSFPDRIMSSSAFPLVDGSGLWTGFVELEMGDGTGAFVNVAACASNADEFRRVSTGWFERWGQSVVEWDEVRLYAAEEDHATLVNWTRDNFGFFHGRYYGFATPVG